MRRSISLRPIGAALVSLAMVCFVGAQTKKQREQAKKLMEAADRSFTAKNYTDAAEKYGQSLSIVATNPVGNYRRGFSHFELAQYEPALSEFAAALSQGFHPAVEIYRVRTYIYLQQKNWDAALADAAAARQLLPRDPEFAKAMVEAYLGKGETGSALEILKKAAALAPNDPDVDYYLARTYAQTGDRKAQQESAENALKKGTRMVAESYLLLGQACDRQHSWQCSIEAYTHAMAAKPGTQETYRSLAEAYRSDGRYADAIATTKKAMAELPQSADLYTDLSWFYSVSDDPSAAISSARTAIAFAPTSYLAYTQLCRAYNDNKQYDLAIGACNRALQLKPGDGETYFYLGRAMNLSGRNTEATKMYSLAVKGLEEYVTKLPDYSDGFYLLGNAYFADNQRDKAAEAYLKCLEISPKYSKAHYNLGIIYTRKKMKPAAQEQFNALQKLDPKLADLLKAEIDKM